MVRRAHRIGNSCAIWILRCEETEESEGEAIVNRVYRRVDSQRALIVGEFGSLLGLRIVDFIGAEVCGRTYELRCVWSRS